MEILCILMGSLTIFHMIGDRMSSSYNEAASEKLEAASLYKSFLMCASFPIVGKRGNTGKKYQLKKHIW